MAVRIALVMDEDESRVYVDAAAKLLAMPLAGVDRAVVFGVMQRLAAYAADVAAYELALDVEIAGRFDP